MKRPIQHTSRAHHASIQNIIMPFSITSFLLLPGRSEFTYPGRRGKGQALGGLLIQGEASLFRENMGVGKWKTQTHTLIHDNDTSLFS